MFENDECWRGGKGSVGACPATYAQLHAVVASSNMAVERGWPSSRLKPIFSCVFSGCFASCCYQRVISLPPHRNGRTFKKNNAERQVRLCYCCNRQIEFPISLRVWTCRAFSWKKKKLRHLKEKTRVVARWKNEIDRTWLIELENSRGLRTSKYNNHTAFLRV